MIIKLIVVMDIGRGRELGGSTEPPFHIEAHYDVQCWLCCTLGLACGPWIMDAVTWLFLSFYCACEVGINMRENLQFIAISVTQKLVNLLTDSGKLAHNYILDLVCEAKNDYEPLGHLLHLNEFP